jgi:quercetin dioxygenase-like cupin family protein
MTEQLIAQENARLIRPNERPNVDILGIHCQWRVMPEETGDSYSLIDNVAPPGTGVPLHNHAAPETFVILEGKLEFGRLGPHGPEWLAAGPGDTFHIPGGVMHGFRNAGDTVARLLCLFRADLAAFFEETGVPATPGIYRPPSEQEIARGLSMMRKHGMQFADQQQIERQ